MKINEINYKTIYLETQIKPKTVTTGCWESEEEIVIIEDTTFFKFSKHKILKHNWKLHGLKGERKKIRILYIMRKEGSCDSTEIVMWEVESWKGLKVRLFT